MKGLENKKTRGNRLLLIGAVGIALVSMLLPRNVFVMNVGNVNVYKNRKKDSTEDKKEEQK